MRTTVLMTLAAVAATNLWAIQGTLSTETETISGDIKWQPRDKQYVIEKGKVTKEIPLADVSKLDIPEPKGFAEAQKKVEEGKDAAQAIPALQKIISDYRMLTWDKKAGRYLALAYLAAGNAEKAYSACQSIILEDKPAAYTGDLAPAYWQAMLKLGKMQQLENLLKKAATSGDRASSAAALVMRGDIIVSTSNDAPDKLRDALRDGYLRVVLMYQDADCAREHAEACLKAAHCFDKLGQAARAEKLRQQAKAI